MGFGAQDFHILQEASDAPVWNERITVIDPPPAVSYKKQWLMFHLEGEVKDMLYTKKAWGTEVHLSSTEFII